MDEPVGEAAFAQEQQRQAPVRSGRVRVDGQPATKCMLGAHPVEVEPEAAEAETRMSLRQIGDQRERMLQRSVRR
ncbi:hypothetical protein LJR084_002391 [Variovorax sp. LjRoot84]|uniref:hypothetical protein n=1 Tax=Variovorax sp. LjRoot84 TaxID=3342340 RepID=UPI003ED08471